MRIVFMGTPDFAVPCLEKLIQCGHKVVGVFSQPDKPVGRKQILTPPEVKVCAQKYDIPVFQPKKLKGSDAVDIIRSLAPDVIVVVAYGKILPKEILTAAKHGCINVHASILPQYRGAAPIQWAVINGDKETGVSIMQMDEGLDTGDVIIVKKTDIDRDETSAELFDRLSVIGADALAEVLDSIENGTAVATKQGDDTGCQYAQMITKDLCPICWTDSSIKIHNLVRGLQTWPVAITKINGKNVKIHKTELTEITCDFPAQVVDNKKELLIGCGDGKCLRILSLQPEGKKKMDAKSFLAGNKIEINTKIGD